MLCSVPIPCARTPRDFPEEGPESFTSRPCARVFLKKKGKYLGFYHVYALTFSLQVVTVRIFSSKKFKCIQEY